jgi:RimJ/RimL family protein N-acetyltransferase
MGTEYRRITAGDADELADFLAGREWPFHAPGRDREAIRAAAAAGKYSSETDQAYWITVPGETIGFLHVFELDDPTPMFDLRIAADHRGRGHGTAAVRWLTGMVFDGFPDATRIEGNTRQDNIAMRRTFVAAGYQKEARYRESWPGATGGTARSPRCAGTTATRIAGAAPGGLAGQQAGGGAEAHDQSFRRDQQGRLRTQSS